MEWEPESDELGYLASSGGRRREEMALHGCLGRHEGIIHGIVGAAHNDEAERPPLPLSAVPQTLPTLAPCATVTSHGRVAGALELHLDLRNKAATITDNNAPRTPAADGALISLAFRHCGDDSNRQNGARALPAPVRRRTARAPEAYVPVDYVHVMEY